MNLLLVALALLAVATGPAAAWRPAPVATADYPRYDPAEATGASLGVNGIFPALTATASSGPKRSECGVGGLMPWADHLYMVSYLSVPNAGSGTGLYEISPNMTMRQIAAHNSTYANRLMHPQAGCGATSQIIIGAWAIDLERNVRAFPDLLTVRVGGVATHLTNPDTMVYMLGMDGPLWECNVLNMSCTQIFDLVKELDIPAAQGEQPHFKACHTMNGRLVVASNTFEEADFLGQQHGGRLAEWEGPGHSWTILERTAFVEVAGRFNFGKVIYAVGWDARSVILKVMDGGDGPAPTLNPQWQTFRLPKASHAFDHLWQTEWPRIREVATERYLLDAHAMFYELSPLGWGGSTWGIRPICQHVRVIPDYTAFRGFFVAGSNQVSSIFDNNLITGQAQSGLWFGKVDDLWGWGKPQGWGGPWRNDSVVPGSTSDPFLMTGFDHKTLHVTGVDCSGLELQIQIDYTGGAAGGRINEPWNVYKSISVDNYAFETFPAGFSAHW